jgi:hypothetical protein
MPRSFPVVAVCALALCACTGGGSGDAGGSPQSGASTSSVSAPPGVPGIKTIKIPALKCKDPKAGVSTQEVITHDLKVVTTDSNEDVPGDHKLYDERLMLYKGNACADEFSNTQSTLDLGEADGPAGHTRGLVGSIPAADNECAAAARNQNWDDNFDLDVRNLDGKTVCVLDYSSKVYAVTISVDEAASVDPHLPALELQVKLY